MQTQLVNVHKEPYDICIMRPGPYSNPFKIGVHGNRDEVIQLFEDDFIRRMKTDPQFRLLVVRLEGKRIGCCCSPLPCHGDVYIKYFNGEYDDLIAISASIRNRKEENEKESKS